MPAIIDLRRRIKSVRNTQQITQAMKTVSTAKFKKAQRTVLEGRPYWHGSPELIEIMTAAAAPHVHPLLEVRQERRIEVLVMTSDKGLAGAFNANLLEKAQEFIAAKAETCHVRLTLMGKKSVIAFKRLSYPISRTYTDVMQNLTAQDFESLADDLMRDYALNRTDAVYVAYNEFKSILAPRVTVTRLLPLEPAAPEEAAGAYDWEPGSAAFLQTLLPRFVQDQLCHFFFESIAAEHAARMMAMDNATKNAEELVGDLTLLMNKIRQASITKELLEIMSAVEALAKNR